MIDRSQFSRRLRIAFDGAMNAEIARRIESTDAVIKGYMDGKNLPTVELLLRIHRATGINLHWLLTGEGPERVTPTKPIFSVEEEDQVRELAHRSKRSFEEEIRSLTMAAIEFKRSLD